MTGWLIYDEEGAKRNAGYIEMHFELAKEFGIKLYFFLDTQISDLLKNNRISLPDFCFVRTICPLLSYRLEKAGIAVFNPALVSEICNDKGKTIMYVQEHTEVRTIPTMRFKRHELSEELLLQYPDSVVKSVSGHGGNQVFLSKEGALRIGQGIGEDDFVIQPFIHGPGKDIRVYVIGNRIMGAVARKAIKGFRANYSLGGEITPYDLNVKERQQVYSIISCMPFGMVGIDFVVDKKGKLLFNEIEDVVGARMYYHCYPERNLLRDYFLYVMKHL